MQLKSGIKYLCRNGKTISLVEHETGWLWSEESMFYYGKENHDVSAKVTIHAENEWDIISEA